MLNVSPFDAAVIAWNRLVPVTWVLVLVTWHVDFAPTTTAVGARVAIGAAIPASRTSATNGRWGLIKRGMSTSDGSAISVARAERTNRGKGSASARPEAPARGFHVETAAT